MGIKQLFQSVRRQPPAASSPLTREALLASDLWVDQPGAQERIDGWRRKGEIDGEQAEKLRSFVERGYLIFDAGLPPRLYDELAADVDRMWTDKPADLAYSPEGPLRSFAHADRARDRRPSYRIADLYSHSAAALEVYLWQPIFSHAEQIFR